MTDEPGSASEPPFRVGDRVKITNPHHPWFGHAGRLAGPFPVVGLPWEVALDDPPSHRSACAESDLHPDDGR